MFNLIKRLAKSKTGRLQCILKVINKVYSIIHFIINEIRLYYINKYNWKSINKGKCGKKHAIYLNINTL